MDSYYLQSRRVLARASGAQQPFLAAWRAEVSKGEHDSIEIDEDATAEPAGFSIETLALCDACPVPEACALKGHCRIAPEATTSAAASPEDVLPNAQAVSAQNAIVQSEADTHDAAPSWHTLAAVDAQAQAEARGQTWLNAPGRVERVLNEMQAATWAAWHAWWRRKVSKAEAGYRQSVEVHWATAIFAGKHPGVAILPAWHREQLPAYLRQVYYHQDQATAWEAVPSLDEVVEGVMWACSDAANLRFQGLYFPEEAMTPEWLDRLKAEMAEDVVMHAAYLRGLVEDKG